MFWASAFVTAGLLVFILRAIDRSKECCDYAGQRSGALPGTGHLLLLTCLMLLCVGGFIVDARTCSQNILHE